MQAQVHSTDNPEASQPLPHPPGPVAWNAPGTQFLSLLKAESPSNSHSKCPQLCGRPQVCGGHPGGLGIWGLVRRSAALHSGLVRK